MALWIEQTNGERVELAKAALDAVNTGDLDKAEKIFESVTGKKFAKHNKRVDHPWLLYCMPRDIRAFCNDSVWPNSEPKHCNDRAYYEKMRQNAERHYGGKWAIRYEY